MPRHCIFRGAALILVLALLPALAVADRHVPGKHSRQPGREGPYLPEVIDCSDLRQDLVLSPQTMTVYTDSTSGDGAIDNYACANVTLSGPEHIYRLTAETDLYLDAGLAGNDPDLDLVLLSDCDTDSCLVHDNTEFSAQLSAGAVVYLVVDGYQSAAGTYSLSLQTRDIGISESICEGGAVPIDISDTEASAFEGDLFDQPNLVSVYDCASYTVRGGERWYELNIAPNDTAMFNVTVTASTIRPTLDLVLWLFDGCGPDAICLDWADSDNAGGTETLSWSNPDADLLTVYLAVDCIALPDTTEGTYEIDFTTVVPVEASSLSDVRDLFR